MEELRVGAYSPAEIAKKVATVAQKKSGLDFFRLFVLAILAGAFISLGAEFYTLVVHDSGLAFGLNKLVGGLAFSLGLILVVLAGAELFTGNTLMVIGFVDGIINTRSLLRSWAIAYIGNLVGSLALVLLMYSSRQWTFNNAMVGGKALLIANAKVNLTFVEAFGRGILCNALVCLAVWLCFGARSTSDKILAIIFPITAFVASGFEHSVANMYFVPMGIILKGEATVVAAAEAMAGKQMILSNLTVSGFLISNLLPVTLGNIIGGSLFVGLTYWSIYLRQFSFQSLLRMIQIAFRLIFLLNPRDFTPSRIAANLSGFYAFLSRRKVKQHPLPRDLSALLDDTSREKHEAKS